MVKCFCEYFTFGTFSANNVADLYMNAWSYSPDQSLPWTMGGPRFQWTLSRRTGRTRQDRTGYEEPDLAVVCQVLSMLSSIDP